MDGIFKAAALVRSFCCFTRLVGHGADMKLLPAELEHLRHEGHASDASVISQRGEDFLFGPNFYNIARAKTRQTPTHRTSPRLPRGLVSLETVL